MKLSMYPVDHIKEYETNIKDGIKSYISDNGLGRDFILSELFLTLDVYRKIKNPPKIILIGGFWKPIFESLSIISEKDMKLITIVSDYSEFVKLF